MKNFVQYLISKDATIKDALIQLNELSDNVLTLFVTDGRKMVGTLTDGDVRRALIKDISINESVDQVMEVDFKYIYPGEKDLQKIKDIRALGIQLLPCITPEGEILRIYNLRKKKALLAIDAILMAGGKGERLRPLTETVPKPLLKVGSKAIIDYNIDNLISYGVENIHVTTNYLAEQIEQHFQQERDGIPVKCMREQKFLGTIASVKLIDSLCHDDVLVMNSDLFTNIDFEDFYRHFKEKDADMSVAAIPYSINVPYGVFELDGRNIQSIREKPTYNYYANAGIYLIKRSLLELIPNGDYMDATDFIELLISKNKKVVRYPLVGYWIDIGKLEDFKKAQDLVDHIKS